MKREFLLNIIFLVAVNLLIKPIYIFGIDLQVQNTVGVDTYGLYFTLFNFTFLLQIINDFGIQQFNSRRISQEQSVLKSYFPNIIMFKTLLGILYVGAVFLIAKVSGYDIALFSMIGLMCIIHILNSLILYLRSNIAGLGWYRTDSVISSLSKFLMILGCGALLYLPNFKNDFTILWFIYAQIITLAITALIALALTSKELKKIDWKFDPSFLKKIAKETYPYALAIFLMTVYTRVDVVMIERMLPDGLTEAGIYAAAYRLLDASNMIGFLFAGLLLPMFSRMIKEKAPFLDLLQFSFQLIMVGAITVSVVIYFFQQEIMDLLYIESTTYWGVVLGYLILSFIAVCAIYVYSALLTANENLKQMNKIFVVGILLNVLLNYFLILSQKAAGAALATLITQTFIAIALILLTLIVFKIKVNVTLLLKMMAFSILAIVMTYLVINYSSLDWKVNFVISILLNLTMAFILKLISLNSIADLLPMNKFKQQ